MGKVVKYWPLTGAVIGVDEGDHLPDLPPEIAALSIPEATVVDPTAVYVSDGELVEREPISMASRKVLAGEEFTLGLPIDSHWTFEGQGGGDATLMLDQPGVYTLTLQGRYSGSVEVRVTTIEAARADRWTQAKAVRDAAMSGGCETALGRVQTDMVSWFRISGALQSVQPIGPAQSIDWTMSDNSVVTHTADEMRALATAVSLHFAACQNAGTAIRNAINEAETLDALDRIDITAGYPDGAQTAGIVPSV